VVAPIPGEPIWLIAEVRDLPNRLRARIVVAAAFAKASAMIVAKA
jgi:hypothetical protein